MELSKIVTHLDRLLDHEAVSDYDNAFNGLQIENSGVVHRIGAAVDASEATLRLAARANVDFLLVHHGLFWPGVQRVEGPFYRKLKLAFNADMAVYSSHLPLDLHPALGNNACLIDALGKLRKEPFLMDHGQRIGFKAKLRVDREKLRARLEQIVGGPVRLIPGGPVQTGVVGVVSGGAGEKIAQAAKEGVDTYITGEAPHWVHAMAEELGINLLIAGHYATETFGVKAVAARLAEKFRLPWKFLDNPSGL